MTQSITIQIKHLHLDSGEMIPAVVQCSPGKPLEIIEGSQASVDIVLPDDAHVALGRVDPHVHFRESYIPTRDEFEDDPYRKPDVSYDDVVAKVNAANALYDARVGSLAALKGGVWLVGAMGNTPWAPLGQERWQKTLDLYQKKSLVKTQVYPRIEPNVEPVIGQEEKDFGSTFGGSGLPYKQRREMYLKRSGGMISYHNDQPRADESIEAFRDRTNPEDYLLHSLYFDGETVLACQRETLALAKEANLKQLTTRHIPTGPALDMLLQARGEVQTKLIAEVGLDYMYWNRDMLAESDTKYVNYRRPAHPSKEDQLSLIELTRECAQQRDPLTFFGSDHAPHALAAKAFQDGLPGSPGTRVLELTHQIHMHLIQQHGFTHADIDWLSSIAPAKYLAEFMNFDFPAGTMQNGAMANLVVFDPNKPYQVDESQLKQTLQDQEYHSAYRDEQLMGEVLFTVVDGKVYDVSGEIKSMN